MANEKPFLVAHISPLEDMIEGGIELAALARNAASQFQEIIKLSPSLPDELKVTVLNVEEPGKLADIIAANLNLSRAVSMTGFVVRSVCVWGITRLHLSLSVQSDSTQLPPLS